MLKSIPLPHVFNDNAICIYCGFDAASFNAGCPPIRIDNVFTPPSYPVCSNQNENLRQSINTARRPNQEPEITEPASTEEPVFTSTCFTGQPQTDREEVLCNSCKNGLVTLRGSGWFDSYVPYGNHLGSYVHFECLSPRRKDELRLEGYRFDGDPTVN